MFPFSPGSVSVTFRFICSGILTSIGSLPLKAIVVLVFSIRKGFISSIKADDISSSTQQVIWSQAQSDNGIIFYLCCFEVARRSSVVL